MLFVFRGVRALQVILAIVTLAAGVGCTVLLKSFADSDALLSLIVALLLGAVFLWAFTATLRIPTSFVAISEERTRIRFAGFIDRVIDNRSVVSARLVKHPLIAGLGVRTNFRGGVALASAPGTAVELELSSPVRVWLVPRLIPLRARRLTLSVRNPEKMVERFSQPGRAVIPAGVAPNRKTRRGRR